MVYWFQPCAIIDLTMGNGAWAVVALQQGLPYFGVALTEAHHEEVLARLKVKAGIAESRPDECNANFAYGAQLLFVEGKVVFVTPPAAKVPTMLSSLDMEGAGGGSAGASAKGGVKKTKKDTKKANNDDKLKNNDDKTRSRLAWTGTTTRTRAPLK